MRAHDETARSVLGNVAAMEQAVALLTAAKPLRLEDVLEIHRVLMLSTATPEFPGELRERQDGERRFYRPWRRTGSRISRGGASRWTAMTPTITSTPPSTAIALGNSSRKAQARPRTTAGTR